MCERATRYPSTDSTRLHRRDGPPDGANARVGEPRAGLAELQAAFLAEGKSDAFALAVRGQRAAIHEQFARLDDGRLSLTTVVTHAADRRDPDPWLRAASWAYAPHAPADHADYLETTTRLLAVTALPEQDQRAALAAVPQVPADLDHLLSRHYLTKPSIIHDASLRSRAQLRCAAVGLAVERFRQREGRWPQSLDALPTDLLQSVPLDPFDGRPLRYVRRTDGVTIYSVGLDRTDDGGTISPSRPPNEPGQDFGFRLYDLQARSLAPTPVNGDLEDIGREVGPMPRIVGMEP
jgi:hypothetical protein